MIVFVVCSWAYEMAYPTSGALMASTCILRTESSVHTEDSRGHSVFSGANGHIVIYDNRSSVIGSPEAAF